MCNTTRNSFLQPIAAITISVSIIAALFNGVNMKQAISKEGLAPSISKKQRNGATVRRRPTSYQGIVSNLPQGLQEKLTYSRSVYSKTQAITRWLMTYGNTLLTRQEFSVLFFILSRTTIFGKQAEMITKEHYMQGVWSEEELVCSPCNINPRDLYKSIKSLEAQGYIKVTPVQFRGRKLPTIYEIEIDFILAIKPSEEIMSKLRLPKSMKTADIIDFEAFRLEKERKLDGSKWNHGSNDSLVPNGTTNNINIKTEDYEVLVAPRPLRNEVRKRRIRTPSEIDCKKIVREVINVTSARVTLKQEEKVRRGRRSSIKNISLQDLNATWKRCMVEKFGNCTIAGLTHKEYGMFKRIAKTHELSCTFHDFATWAINNWQRLNKESKEYSNYRKRKDGDWSMTEEDRVFLGTDFPEVFMLVKNYGKLVKRYAQESMNGKVVDTEDQLRKENDALKKKLKETSFEAASAKATLQRVTRQSATVKRERKPVRVVNPEKDDFFSKADTTLPDWK